MPQSNIKVVHAYFRFTSLPLNETETMSPGTNCFLFSMLIGSHEI